jgi:hypothetical protein
MSLTKLFLAGNNKIFPGQGGFGKWHPSLGRENGLASLFLQLMHSSKTSVGMIPCMLKTAKSLYLQHKREKQKKKMSIMVVSANGGVG